MKVEQKEIEVTAVLSRKFVEILEGPFQLRISYGSIILYIGETSISG